MHVSIRLHLVHAVIADWGEAVAVLVSVRRALLRLRIQGLTVTTERWRSVLRGRCLEAGCLAVDRRSVRSVGTCASTAD